MAETIQKNKKFIEALIAGSLIFNSSGCIIPECRNFKLPKEVIEKRVYNKTGLIVGIEGLQPWSGCNVHRLVNKLGKELGLAYSTSSGNWGSHIDLIKEAYKNRNKIFLIGYSAGTEEVWNIAKKCQEKNIKVDLIIYLDPTHKKNIITGPITKIPSNVKEVLTFIGENSGWFGGRFLGDKDFKSPYTKFENYLIYGASHLDLPNNNRVYDGIKSKIEKILEE